MGTLLQFPKNLLESRSFEDQCQLLKSQCLLAAFHSPETEQFHFDKSFKMNVSMIWPVVRK